PESTLVTTPRPLGRTGSHAVSLEPSPPRPPQHQRSPDVVRTQVAPFPAAICAASLMSLTTIGSSLVFLVPSPRTVLPQHSTLPAARRAHVYRSPPSTSTMSSRPGRICIRVTGSSGDSPVPSC